MKEYQTTIGLEIHAELKTKSKMFCGCVNNPDEEKPNFNICPVCTAQPGTLPVINKQAVKNVLKVGLALNGQLADFTEFDRKNYFYPDIPKGYQISQYKFPLVSGGELNGVKITRVHLEEDTASSLHKGDYSLINYNRGGVPLMELVTEPVIKNGKEAGDFARELQLLLRYLGVSDANMEKGEMRVEANISISDTDKLGTKVEIKNLNSFKVVEKAVAYEIERQKKVLESGEKVIQETRGWDDNRGITFSQRIKEGSDDYRYFPDPDLPKLKLSEISEFTEDELKKEIPELPQERRKRYSEDYGIKAEDIESYILDKDLAELFEAVVSNFSDDKNIIKLASNYLTSDLIGLMKNNNAREGFGGVKSDNFVALIQLVKQDKISSRGAKDILAILYMDGGDPEKIAEVKNLFQQSNEDELQKIVDEVIAKNPKVVEEYRNGKESVLGFLIGQAMKLSGGASNPQLISKLFKKEL
ncbi:MAG: Asp-tRNA(Asn)/Glu-tRNA(Gln) amidotransferase subunit GatB [Patescibacteria group bacterium]